MSAIVDLVEHQVIAAVRSPDELAKAMKSKANIIFLLFGNVLNIAELVEATVSARKSAFVHIDLIEGIATDKPGVQYIAQKVRPTGIITTRHQTVSMARDHGLMTIQRLFLIDSIAIEKGLKSVRASGADAVEIMPGIMPGVINELTELTPLPIIAGGLVKTEQDVLNALHAGALAVSVGNAQLWEMDL